MTDPVELAQKAAEAKEALARATTERKILEARLLLESQGEKDNAETRAARLAIQLAEHPEYVHACGVESNLRLQAAVASAEADVSMRQVAPGQGPAGE